MSDIIDPTKPNQHSKYDMTKEEIKKMLPRGTHHTISDRIIELVHNFEEDTGMSQEYLEEQFYNNIHVLKGSRADIVEYINALKFCTLKQHMSNTDAWKRVFPQKYKKLEDRGAEPHSHVSMFNQSMLVTKIDELMMIPAHIQYMPLYHKAIQKQFELMNGKAAKIGVDKDTGEDIYGKSSATVQHLAAKELAELVKPPVENQLKITLDTTDEQKSVQQSMLDQMTSMAENQQKLLQQGYSIEEIQKINFTHGGETIDAEIEDAD